MADTTGLSPEAAPETTPLLINASTSSANRSSPELSSRPSSSSLGFFAVIFLTVNATLGAGLLNIPYSFDQSGIYYAVGFQAFHVILVICSLMIINFCANISNVDSLQSLVEHFAGPKWRNLCSLAIVIYSYGACVTYLIIIGDQFDKIFEFYYGPDFHHHWYMQRDFLMTAISMLAILPLCVSKDISFLKFASFVGFLSTFYFTALVMLEYLKLKPVHVTVKPEPKRITSIFKVLPVLAFSYQCQLSWVPTYAEIGDKSSWRIFGMIFCSMMICFLSYTWTAVFGLLTFGSGNIQKDMMQNYNPRDPFVAFGMVLLIVKTVVVYPILMYCGRIVLEQFIHKIINPTPEVPNAQKDRSVRISAAILWVLSSAILAITVPNIAVAINYLGSLANLFVFILPGLCLYLILFDPNQYEQALMNHSGLVNRTTILVTSILFISYGCGVFSYSLCLSIVDLINEHV